MENKEKKMKIKTTKEKRKEQIRKLQRSMFVNEEYFKKKKGEIIKNIECKIRFSTEEIKELKGCIKILKEEDWIK